VVRSSHEAYVSWEGDFRSGEGRFELGSGGSSGWFDSESRSTGGFGATPEELLGVAHASSFTMTLAKLLASRGYDDVKGLRTRAVVRVSRDRRRCSISSLVLQTRAEVGGIGAETFGKLARVALENCVMSGVLSTTDIELDARLVGVDGNSPP
jgi:osmotically inducible protein OsmC